MPEQAEMNASFRTGAWKISHSMIASFTRLNKITSMNSFALRASLFLALLSLLAPLSGGAAANDGVAPKPLFRDPVHDGAAAPSVNHCPMIGLL